MKALGIIVVVIVLIVVLYFAYKYLLGKKIIAPIPVIDNFITPIQSSSFDKAGNIIPFSDSGITINPDFLNPMSPGDSVYLKGIGDYNLYNSYNKDIATYIRGSNFNIPNYQYAVGVLVQKIPNSDLCKVLFRKSIQLNEQFSSVLPDDTAYYIECNLIRKKGQLGDI